MRLVYALVCGVAMVWAYGVAIIASEDAAISARYTDSDQFLSSILK